jgi:hypothetical protein
MYRKQLLPAKQWFQYREPKCAANIQARKAREIIA